MTQVKLAAGVLLCSFLLVWRPPCTDALCCNGGANKDKTGCNPVKFCADCKERVTTGGNMWVTTTCCSQGKCNVYCCNCDAPCRKAPAGQKAHCYSGGFLGLSSYCKLVD